jgi:hypothetical protein
MDDEAVAAAISRIDANMQFLKEGIAEIKSNCTRTETARGEDIQDLYEKHNNLALKVKGHGDSLAAHNRYFGYTATILVGIIITVIAAVIVGRL